MLQTPHSLVGAALGAASGNPTLAAPLGFASHLLGDLLPHWNPSFPYKSKLLYALNVADFIISIVVIGACWVLFTGRPEVVIGAIFAILPDLIAGFRYIFKIRWLRWYEKAHEWLQTDVPARYGIWPQLALSLASVWYLLKQI